MPLAKTTSLKFWLAAVALLSALAPIFCFDDVARDFTAPDSFSRGALSTLPRVDPAGVLQVWTWNQFSVSEFRRGHFPLWNPHTALGQPHLANLQTAVFYPLWLAQAWLTDPFTSDLILLLRLAVAATLVFMLVYNRGGKASGALAAALIYAYGGYGLWFLQLVDLNSQLLLPLLMLVFNKLFTRRTWPRFLAAAIVVALVIFGGHPEAVFNTLAVASLYVLFLFAAARPPRRPLLSALLPLAAAGLIGTLAAGLTLLPFLNYLPRCWSLHLPGFGFFHLEARGLLNLFWPGIHRIFADQPAAIPLGLLERGTLGLLGSGYRETAVPGAPPGLGAIPMLFALWAIARLRRLPPLAAFFAALLAVLLGLTFGLPGFRLLALLPILNLASNFKFYFSEIHLSLAVLAGFGLDHLLRAFGSRRSADFRGAPTPDFRGAATPDFRGAATPDFRGAPDPRRASKRAPKRATWTSIALLIALIANLFYHSRDVKPYLDLGTDSLFQTRAAPDFFPAFLQEQQAASGPFRLTGLEGFFPANLALSFGLDDLRSSDALFYRPYLDLLNRLNGLDDQQALRYFYPSYYTQPSPERLDRPLAALLGIRYAVGLRPLEPGEIIEHLLFYGSGVYGVVPPQKQVDMSLRPPQPVLFQHPPSRLDWNWESDPEFRLRPRPTRLWLKFSPWLDRRAKSSDGVSLILTGGKELLFARFLPPSRLPQPRFQVAADLTQPLHFAAAPGPRDNRDSDWAGWAGVVSADAPQADFHLQELTDQKGRSVYLAEFPQALPRAFSVSQTLAIEPKNLILNPPEEAAILSSLDPGKLRESALVRGGVELKGIPGDRGKVELLRYDPDRVELEVRRASEGLLILADAYYPGWRAFLDQAEAKIVPADHALRGLALAPGKHRVVFVFQPMDFRIGLWTSLVTLVLAGAALSLSLRKKRAAHD
jgi:hypothetical protein